MVAQSDRLPMTTPTRGADGLIFICDEIVSEQPLTPDAGVLPLHSQGVVLPCRITRHRMPKGTVKWFNDKKGFGFIVDPEMGEDIFVHFSVIANDGYRTLKDGDEVEYEVEKDQKGSRAKSVVRI